MDNDEKLRRIKKACKWGGVSFDKLVSDCREGVCQWHENENACCATTLEISDAGKTCYIVVGAGTLAGYARLKETVENFAREHGCNYLTAIGRNGFVKLFNKLDPEFKPVAIKFAKKLN